MYENPPQKISLIPYFLYSTTNSYSYSNDLKKKLSFSKNNTIELGNVEDSYLICEVFFFKDFSIAMGKFKAITPIKVLPNDDLKFAGKEQQRKETQVAYASLGILVGLVLAILVCFLLACVHDSKKKKANKENKETQKLNKGTQTSKEEINSESEVRENLYPNNSNVKEVAHDLPLQTETEKLYPDISDIKEDPQDLSLQTVSENENLHPNIKDLPENVSLPTEIEKGEQEKTVAKSKLDLQIL